MKGKSEMVRKGEPRTEVKSLLKRGVEVIREEESEPEVEDSSDESSE